MTERVSDLFCVLAEVGRAEATLRLMESAQGLWRLAWGLSRVGGPIPDACVRAQAKRARRLLRNRRNAARLDEGCTHPIERRDPYAFACLCGVPYKAWARNYRLDADSYDTAIDGVLRDAERVDGRMSERLVRELREAAHASGLDPKDIDIAFAERDLARANRRILRRLVRKDFKELRRGRRRRRRLNRNADRRHFRVLRDIYEEIDRHRTEMFRGWEVLREAPR